MLWIYLWFLIGAVTGFYVIKTDYGVVRIRHLPCVAAFTLCGLISTVLVFWFWLEAKITDEELEKFMNKRFSRLVFTIKGCYNICQAQSLPPLKFHFQNFST